MMTSFRVQQVIECVDAGMTAKEIAAELEVTYSSVINLCDREEIVVRRESEISAERNEKAVAEVMKGKRTIPEVAAEFGVSTGHVSRLLRGRGLRAPHMRSGGYNRGKSAEAFELMKREHLSIQEAARRLKIASGSLRSYIQRRERTHDDDSDR